MKWDAAHFHSCWPVACFQRAQDCYRRERVYGGDGPHVADTWLSSAPQPPRKLPQVPRKPPRKPPASFYKLSASPLQALRHFPASPDCPAIFVFSFFLPRDSSVTLSSCHFVILRPPERP